MRNIELPTPAEPLVPHCGTMSLIDTLLVAEEGRGLCRTTLCKGHLLLGDDGLMDRCGFVELGAQAHAVSEGYHLARAGLPFPVGYLVGVQSFECLADAREGDELTIETESLGTFEGFGVVQATIRRGEETLAQGRIKLYVPEARTDDAEGVGGDG